MAEIKGKLIASVTINASAGELFMALAKEFEIDEIFKDQRGVYSKAELVKEGGEETPYIIRYEDTSYHGCPYYEEASRRKISTKQYQIVQSMRKIRSLMTE